MKKQSGITLVALIVTIIVLLILAAVTISTFNEGGIIDKSRAAKEKYSKEAAYEESELLRYNDIMTNIMTNNAYTNTNW